MSPSTPNTDAKLKKGVPITIVVRSQNNGEIAFKVKINTLFSRIVSAYCQKMGIASGSIRFHDDGGQRINEAQTIAELDLDPEDYDDGNGPKAYVDAFLEQTGGGAL